MDDEQLRKRKAYFEGRKPFTFDNINITHHIKAMNALMAESIALMWDEPYPRIEDL